MPRDAERSRNPRCSSVERHGLMDVCGFGAAAGHASRTVALVGDSHASHWRAAMDIVARGAGWHGLSIVRSSCPLSTATRLLDEPARAQCTQWNREVLTWFRAHPEVSVVFVSGLSGGRGVVTPPGESRFGARIRGYLGAWDALPDSVRHIVVLRDTPKVYPRTLRCVDRAARAHRNAGRACAVRRRDRLDPDAAVAASRLRSPRAEPIDLTRYFCDAHRCFPVIGGALAYRDGHHLTSAFVRTFAPPLRELIDRLSASWR